MPDYDDLAFKSSTPPPIAFRDACDVVIPFGEFNGSTIARIGASDEGLKRLDYYLAWADCHEPIRDAIKVYLRNPAIAARLNYLLDD